MTTSGIRVDQAWRDRLVIGLAHTLAWGLLLVNRGLYWDDWALVGLTPTDLVRGGTELGLPWGAYLFAAIYSTGLPGLIAHFISFVAFLLSALLFHAILRRLPWLTRTDALVAALTFAVLPVNVARIAVVDLMYALSLLAFLAATWLLLRFVDTRHLGFRLSALVAFVLSFYTASILVLYAAPIAIAAVLVYRTRQESVPFLVLRHADFLLLPIAYWILKGALFPASGVYEGYNAISLEQLVEVPRAMLAIPGQVLLEPLVRAASIAGPVGVVAGVAMALWLARRTSMAEETRLVPAGWLACVGVALVGLGVFGYLAVGKIPTIWDWSSRHQLLVPLGVGVLAAAVARGIPGFGMAGRASGAVAVGLLIGISIVGDARTLLAYQVDWFKQQAVIEAARTMPELGRARHIRVADTATGFNAVRRTYRFYEWNALLSVAFGDEGRLAASKGTEPRPADLDLFISRPGYHMEGYVPTAVDFEVRIAGGPRPGTVRVLDLVLLEAVGSPSFGPEVSNLIRVQGAPVSP